MADPEEQKPPAKPAKPSRSTANSHFDDKGDGDTRADAAAGGERSRALNEGLSMYGLRTSGVSVAGATVKVGTAIGGDAFFGPNIAGDVYFGVEDNQARPILKMLTTRMVTEIRRVYVQPAGFSALGEPISRTGLLLLGTRPRWGNTATATSLLVGFETVYEVHFTGRLADLPVDTLPAGCGFVLEASDPRILTALTTQDLADLETGLRAAGSRLVVVADADRAAEHGGRPSWRALAAPPDAYEVTLRHLDDRLGSAEQAAELLDKAGIVDQLKAMAPGTFDVHRLVELAVDLAEAARGRGLVADALERFEARADQAVEQWFDSDELAEPHRKALVLALAVLNGMSYDSVSRAAKLLQRRWQAEDPAPAPGTHRRPEPRRQRLKAARARLNEEVRGTRYGAAELEIASFWDPGYPERLLRHYWLEHDYDRDLMLDWLREMAEDVEVAVGVRAALAVGFLATFAFDTIRRDVIVPWAGSGRADERELAVAALAMPARTTGTAARTFRLVADWTSRDAAAPRTAAVRALGGSVGAVLDPGPDELLAKLAIGADGRLATAIGDSVGELLAAAEPDRRYTLLAMLNDWAGEPRSGRQTAGVLAFLQASFSHWVRDEDGPAWPLVLRLAHSDPAVAAVVAKLWGRSLVARGADNGVRMVMRDWALAAERDPAIRAAFVELFAAVPETRRQADLLMIHAEKLRTGKPASPDTARKLLDSLSKVAQP
ncbi:hypothetical protein AB0G04_08430 [Actinoplanes sp. NPDC023801]|uniref:hypothetical protein n=1 Tax=Actinoplanes sp. NPDC023801 TaxID=3154595 RepID=UPI0033F1D3F8